MMGNIKKELGDLFRSLSVASTIALSIVFSIFAGVLVGYWLDVKVFDGKTYPWLTLLFLLFGIGGGIKNFFIMTKRFSKEAKRDEGPSGEGAHKGE